MFEKLVMDINFEVTRRLFKKNFMGVEASKTEEKKEAPKTIQSVGSCINRLLE